MTIKKLNTCLNKLRKEDPDFSNEDKEMIVKKCNEMLANGSLDTKSGSHSSPEQEIQSESVCKEAKE